jgi:hypothetical protein
MSLKAKNGFKASIDEPGRHGVIASFFVRYLRDEPLDDRCGKEQRIEWAEHFYLEARSL